MTMQFRNCHLYAHVSFYFFDPSANNCPTQFPKNFQFLTNRKIKIFEDPIILLYIYQSTNSE